MTARFARVMLVSLVFVGTTNAAAPESYLIEAPDVLRIMADAPATKGDLYDRECLVRPDGTLSLGVYGSVTIAGLDDRPSQGSIRQAPEYASQVWRQGARLRC